MIPTISAVIVGADRLGNIPNLLREHNIAITHHISGRDPSSKKDLATAHWDADGDSTDGLSWA